MTDFCGQIKTEPKSTFFILSVCSIDDSTLLASCMEDNLGTHNIHLSNGSVSKLDQGSW